MSGKSKAITHKLPVMDMKIKSVSDIKRDYSKIAKEISKENEPVFVMNHNTPETVIMSYKFYKEVFVETRDRINELLEVIEAIEDESIVAQATERLESDALTWMSEEEFFAGISESDQAQDNEVDKELFD